MANALKISLGQHSDKGRKEVNQDFYGAANPKPPLLGSKGIVVAVADGIGSSEVSQIAAEFAVRGLIDDYYCTSEAWSVKKSVERVLSATNSWLHAKTQQSAYRYDKDKGYVCTLSALVIKSTTAHIFHVGDTRIYRVHASGLEQLTQDHRVRISETQSYLSRAVGFNPRIDIDYLSLQVAVGDTFLLASDGVYEHLDEAFIAGVIEAGRTNLDMAARQLVDEAYERGSTDNLTAQIVVVDTLPPHNASELHQRVSELPLPPVLEARASFDGYTIVREVHASSRSHIYLAVDTETSEQVIIKTPSIDLGGDAAYLERFLMEEWVARRINSPHVLKPCAQTRERHHLYVATEFIDGQTLTQWMIDHPKPSLDMVRGIVAQVAKGLQAFHRLEMLHQDLRPENIMIDRTGTVKIIDFGATRVAGVAEMSTPLDRSEILGTAQYTAPEYFLGQEGDFRSDMFSLAVITYQMLSGGRLPYGTEVSKSRTPAAQRRLRYDSVLADDRETPAWIDSVLHKALQPDPLKRYESLSEFVHDLHHPNPAYLSKTRPALVERNPVLFWKSVSLVLALVVVGLLMARYGVG
ncbi:MAG: bifunctional protein-serine/threonine kinase/phosphatase [Rhizobacter sp.]|nr:bifunctional protein-serine/threonine kinase/phosphatase [Rhizobacter sp.]